MLRKLQGKEKIFIKLYSKKSTYKLTPTVQTCAFKGQLSKPGAAYYARKQGT